MSTITIQARLKMAENIITETESLLHRQAEFFKWRRPEDLNWCKIQEKKIKEMIADFHRKPDLFSPEELEAKATKLLQ